MSDGGAGGNAGGVGTLDNSNNNLGSVSTYGYSPGVGGDDFVGITAASLDSTGLGGQGPRRAAQGRPAAALPPHDPLGIPVPEMDLTQIRQASSSPPQHAVDCSLYFQSEHERPHQSPRHSESGPWRTHASSSNKKRRDSNSMTVCSGLNSFQQWKLID